LLAVWYGQQRRLARAADQRLELEQQVSDRTYELAQRNRELEEANRKLEMASFTDTLTGLSNRPLSHGAVPAIVAREARRSRPRHHDHRSGCAESPSTTSTATPRATK
jgi:hypothetical protein